MQSALVLSPLVSYGQNRSTEEQAAREKALPDFGAIRAVQRDCHTHGFGRYWNSYVALPLLPRGEGRRSPHCAVAKFILEKFEVPLPGLPISIICLSKTAVFASDRSHLRPYFSTWQLRPKCFDNKLAHGDAVASGGSPRTKSK